MLALDQVAEAVAVTGLVGDGGHLWLNSTNSFQLRDQFHIRDQFHTIQTTDRASLPVPA